MARGIRTRKKKRAGQILNGSFEKKGENRSTRLDIFKFNYIV
jgi:hypothetical protein